MRQTVEKALTAVAGWFAVVGGAVLVAITAMTVVSITGRELNWMGLAPVPGDYELVEAGTAFAIFAFLPWCQMKRGHVTVDLFMARFGPRVNAAVDVISNILMTAVATLIAWRLWLGLLDKKAYSETTFILQFPLWWAYAAAMTGAVFFAVVCLYTIWRSLSETLATRRPSPRNQES